MTDYQPDVIRALQKLWVALPVRAPNDGEQDPSRRQREIMEVYCEALSEASSAAVWNTVSNLIAGKIEAASKNFCPRAPELAEYARAEQRRLDAANRPRGISYQPVSHTFKDWRISQRQTTEELARQGFTLAAENLPQDNFVTMARRKALRPGTIWLWAVQEAWSPPA